MSQIKMVLQFYENSNKAALDAKLAGAERLELQVVNVVESSTGGQRTGITFEFVDTDGKKYFATTTARLVINGIAPAVRGFMSRIGDDPEKA